MYDLETRNDPHSLCFMVLHLKKLCVGVSSVQELRQSIDHRMKTIGEIFHTTRQFPRRAEEILVGGDANGSLYWIIDRKIQVRQRIIEFRRGQKSDGSMGWKILLEPSMMPVQPKRHRAFQGWRYLEEEDAPPDLISEAVLNDIPASLAFEIAEFGVV